MNMPNPKEIDEASFPHVSDALIRRLEELFPPKDVKPSESYEELLHYGGCRKVINFLREQNERQNETILS